MEPFDTGSETLSWRSAASDASDITQQSYCIFVIVLYFYGSFVRLFLKEMINDLIRMSLRLGVD